MNHKRVYQKYHQYCEQMKIVIVVNRQQIPIQHRSNLSRIKLYLLPVKQMILYIFQNTCLLTRLLLPVEIPRFFFEEILTVELQVIQHHLLEFHAKNALSKSLRLANAFSNELISFEEINLSHRQLWTILHRSNKHVQVVSVNPYLFQHKFKISRKCK